MWFKDENSVQKPFLKLDILHYIDVHGNFESINIKNDIFDLFNFADWNDYQKLQLSNFQVLLKFGKFQFELIFLNLLKKFFVT